MARSWRLKDMTNWADLNGAPQMELPDGLFS